MQCFSILRQHCIVVGWIAINQNGKFGSFHFTSEREDSDPSQSYVVIHETLRAAEDCYERIVG